MGKLKTAHGVLERYSLVCFFFQFASRVVLRFAEGKPRDGLPGNPRFVNMVIAALEYRRLRFERV